MVYTIDEIKKIIIPIAKTHGVKSISLFGSYARGEAKENSDFCFCQMCRKAKRKAYIEVTCIQQEPSLFLPQNIPLLRGETGKRGIQMPVGTV